MTPATATAPRQRDAATGAAPGSGDSRIVIVDDEPLNITLLEKLLSRAGYTNVASTTDPREAAGLCTAVTPDIVLIDYNMPHIDGVELLGILKSILPVDCHIPFVMLTGDFASETRRQALLGGAVDFLTKPFDATEVMLRIRNHLHVRTLHVNMEGHVRERTKQLELAHLETIERLAQAAEFRDDETGTHTRRVGESAALIAAALGLPVEQVDVIRSAAPLHDVGKIAIPDSILLKEGRLSPEEMAVMRTHAAIGARLLSGGGSELLRMAERIALTHHERWDGGGYPAGLSGAAIPIEGQIVALADFHDALSHDRRYRKAWPAADVTAEILRESGRHFNPDIVAAFIATSRPGTPIGP